MPEDFTHYTVLKPIDYHPKTENGVIVEMGPGGLSVPQLSERVFRKIEHNALYIGVDYQRKDLMNSRRHAGQFVCGNVTRIPLTDGIADEVWLMNVLGEDDKPLEPELSQAFGELVRILKPEGKIIIGELYTPARWLLNYDFQKLRLQRQVFAGDGATSFIEEYGITAWITRHFFIPEIKDPFFMTLSR